MSEFTESQLREMSDFEVNKVLAEKLGFDVNRAQFLSFDDRSSGVLHSVGCIFDFNNPNDIMPLAFERGISIIKLRDSYAAIHGWRYIDDYFGNCSSDSFEIGCDFIYFDTNPLRAIACLILLMGK